MVKFCHTITIEHLWRIQIKSGVTLHDKLTFCNKNIL